MATDSSFLGRGWKFPPSFDRGQNTVLMSEGVEDIEESIRIILQTIPGERIMQPEFGCFLNKLVFENMETLMEKELNDIVIHALKNFEPRIKEISVSIADKNPAQGVIKINIGYTIIITNTRHNLVYPFYFLEGTNISDKGIQIQQ